MRVSRAALAVLLIEILSAPARAGDKDVLEVVGFDAHGSKFAYWTSGVEDGSGLGHAELNVYSVGAGRKLDQESRQLKLERRGGTTALEELKATVGAELAARGFGKDPGVELYRSGTATSTSFTLSGTPCTLRLYRRRIAGGENPKERVVVQLESARGPRRLYTGAPGHDYSLNSVRLSADGRSLAIFLKYSTRGFEGVNRRYLLVPARIGP